MRGSARHTANMPCLQIRTRRLALRNFLALPALLASLALPLCAALQINVMNVITDQPAGGRGSPAAAQQSPKTSTPTQNPQTKTGTLEIQLRDVMTGYGVSGTVRLAPMQASPEAAVFKSYQTDANGKLIVRLPAGSYLDEETAPGYEIMKGHTGVGPGIVSRGQIMMHPEQMPKELQEEVTKDVLNRNPGTAMIHGYVVDSVTFKPIAGVHLHMERLGASATSDARGYYQLIFPFHPTPPELVGPENDNRETDTIVTSAAGYQTIEEEGVELAAGASTRTIELGRGTGKITIPPVERGHGTEVNGSIPESSVSPLRKGLLHWMGSAGKALPRGRFPHRNHNLQPPQQ